MIAVVGLGGYQAAAANGETRWIPELRVPSVSMPDIHLPEITVPGAEDRMWTWHGVSAGEVRTATIDIDPTIYPIDGVEWIVNDRHDRYDVYGPLDEELGLWHSRTQTFVAGDVISACWQSADGEEHCPHIVVR